MERKKKKKKMNKKSDLKRERLRELLKIMEEKEKEKNSSENEYLEWTKKVREKTKELSIKQRQVRDALNPNSSVSADEYDVVIKGGTVIDLLSEGWTVSMRKEFDPRALDENAFIPIVGMRNRGKTWTINKLANKSLPSGHEIMTPNLCYVIPDPETGLKATIIDNAGAQASVRLRDEDKMGLDEANQAENDPELITRAIQARISRLIERQATDVFLREFVSEEADLIIVVVGVLSHEEQLMLTRMMETRKDKPMIIVHNLKEFVYKESVQRKIENALRCFRGIERATDENLEGQVNREYWVQKSDLTENSPAIKHVVMAGDGTEAGNFYNPLALKKIKDAVGRATRNPNKAGKTFLDRFLLYCNQKLQEYVEVDKQHENTAVEAPFVLAQTETSPEILICDVNRGEPVRRKLKPKTMLLDAVGKPLGTLSQKVWVPEIELYDFQKEVVVILEMPDKLKQEDLKVVIEPIRNSNDTRFIISGNREVKEMLGSQTLLDKRNKGPFQVVVNVDHTTGRHFEDPNNEDIKIKDGLVRIHIRKDNI
eukprot:TRINITY_DN3331_c0_g1_i2.p2 TRINITY_DN3331_c0_g1~~TRINITY_DN3331_c0_g1_i2.p2  ORF type:complete len:542 (-),score=92.72 TRINITY_DN3331_c0_g1_i2:181-1806(-)